MSRIRLTTAFGLLFVTAVAAQVKSPDNLIRIIATVTDTRGRFITDLKAEDFVVRDDAVQQEILQFAQNKNNRLSLGIVLDTSGSMDRKIVRASNAIEDFVETLHRDDEIFLMAFADRPRLVSDFRDGRPEFTTKLRKLNVGGETALYDALNESLREVKLGLNERKVLLLVTDGADSVSSLTYNQIMKTVRESDVLIYCLGIPATFGLLRQTSAEVLPFAGQIVIGVPRPGGGPTVPFPLPGGRTIPLPVPGTTPSPIPLPTPTQPDYGDTVNMSVLESFANATGGGAWRVQDPQRGVGEPIDRILDRLSSELRSQYSIGYKPLHPIDDRQWHDVQIRARERDYTVRHRIEYFGNFGR